MVVPSAHPQIPQHQQEEKLNFSPAKTRGCVYLLWIKYLELNKNLRGTRWICFLSFFFLFSFPPPHSLCNNSYFFEVKDSLYGKLPFLALGSASGWQLATLKRKSHEEIKWRNIWTRLDTSGHCPNTSKMSGGGKDRALPQRQARKGQKQKGIFLRYFKVRCQNIR